MNKKIYIILILIAIVISSHAAVYLQTLSGLTGSYIINETDSNIKINIYNLGLPLVPIMGCKYELDAHVIFPKYIDDAGHIYDVWVLQNFNIWSTPAPPVFGTNHGDDYEFLSWYNYAPTDVQFINYDIDVSYNIHYMNIRNDMYNMDWTNGIPNGSGNASQEYFIDLGNFYGSGSQFWTGDLHFYEAGVVEVTSATISFNTDGFFYPLEIPEPSAGLLLALALPLLLLFRRRSCPCPCHKTTTDGADGTNWVSVNTKRTFVTWPR